MTPISDDYSSYSSDITPSLESDLESDSILMAEQILSEQDLDSSLDSTSFDITEIENFLFDNSSDQKQEVTTSSVVPIGRPIATFDKEFNDMEMFRLSELQMAVNELEEVKYPKPRIFIEVNTIADMYKVFSSLNLMDEAILTSIKFCNTMSLFKEICEEDKVTLFKNNIWKILFVRLLPLVNAQGMYWTYPIVCI